MNAYHGKTNIVFLLLVLIAGAFFLGVIQFPTAAVSLQPPAGGGPVVDQPTEGVPAAAATAGNILEPVTVNIDSNDAASNGNDEVYPQYTLWRNGLLALNNDFSNSTTANQIGDIYDVYVTDQTFYMPQPIKGELVDRQGDYVKATVYRGTAIAGMNMTILNDLNQEVTLFGGQANRSANYNVSVGANTNTYLRVRLKTTTDQRKYAVGALCFGWQGDIQDVKPVNNQYAVSGGIGGKTGTMVPASVPLQLSQAAPSFLNFTGINSTATYKTCWVPQSGPELLNQGEFIELPFYIRGGSTEPTADGNDRVIITAFDHFWRMNNKNPQSMSAGFYVDDINQRVEFGVQNETRAMEVPYSGTGEYRINVVIEST